MKIFYNGEEIDVAKLVFETNEGQVKMEKDGCWGQTVTEEDNFSKLTDALYRIEC